MSGNGSSTRISSNSAEDDEQQHGPDKEDRVAYGNGGGYTKIVKVRPIRSWGMQGSANGAANGLMNGGDFEFSIDSLPITIASSDSSPCSSDSEEVHVLNVVHSPEEDYDKNRCSAPESENDEDEEEVLNRDCIQHEVYMSNLFHQMNNDAGDTVTNGNSSGSASSNSNDSGIENELPVPVSKAARSVQKHSAPANGPSVSGTSGSGVAGGSSGTKRRRVDKTGKGLRHFSMKVCEKVRQKNVTTYNEVADELVAEFTNPANQSYVGEQYDQKNIRRRVYDALNVLMAMNIISKERKEIKWIGLPMNSLQECINLLNERKERFSRVADRLRRLYDVIIHMIAYHQLIARNKEMERTTGELKDSCRLHIPFILVATSKDTFVDCNISQDKSEYLMLYDDKFVIVDDLELLKRMNLTLGLDRGQCTEENLAKAISYVPKVLHRFVTRLATNQMEFTIDDLKDLVNDFEKRNNHIVLPKRSSSSKNGAGQSTSATAGRTENSMWTNVDWCDEESD